MMADSENDINDEIEEAIERMKEIRGNEVFPLFLANKNTITEKTVDDVFESLKDQYGPCGGDAGEGRTLDVVLESSGGKIDAAYNIGLLLRRYAPDELNIIIPRWAKSAATVIACSGDKILMTPVAELGPVDPPNNDV